MEEARRIAENTLRSGRIGRIVCKIAEKLNINLIEAMRRFYESNTCKQFQDRRGDLYLQGDLYVVAEFLDEMGEI